ncbi:hypothetical protein PV325_000644 [Microctonus aethiopoides]|nr:hypothetical protein PV325_000644 [Microctonus aethiopoides]
MPQGRKGESNGIDEEGDGIDDVRGKNEGGKEDEDEDKKKKKKKKKGKWMCRDSHCNGTLMSLQMYITMIYIYMLCIRVPIKYFILVHGIHSVLTPLHIVSRKTFSL